LFPIKCETDRACMFRCCRERTKRAKETTDGMSSPLVSATGTYRVAGIGLHQSVLPNAGLSVPVVPPSEPLAAADFAAGQETAEMNTTRPSPGEAGPAVAADCNMGMSNNGSPAGIPSANTLAGHVHSTSEEGIACTLNDENAPTQHAACLATLVDVECNKGAPDPPLPSEGVTHQGASASLEGGGSWRQLVVGVLGLEEPVVHQGSAAVADLGETAIDRKGAAVHSGQDESVSQPDMVNKDQDEAAVHKDGALPPGIGKAVTDGQERAPHSGHDESVLAQDVAAAIVDKLPVDQQDPASHQCIAESGSDSQHQRTEETMEAWTAKSEF